MNSPSQPTPQAPEFSNRPRPCRPKTSQNDAVMLSMSRASPTNHKSMESTNSLAATSDYNAKAKMRSSSYEMSTGTRRLKASRFTNQSMASSYTVYPKPKSTLPK